MVSKRFTLNEEELAKVATNAVIFFAPAALAFLSTLQATGSFRMSFVAFYTWTLMTVTDFVRKFVEGKK